MPITEFKSKISFEKIWFTSTFEKHYINLLAECPFCVTRLLYLSSLFTHNGRIFEIWEYFGNVISKRRFYSSIFAFFLTKAVGQEWRKLLSSFTADIYIDGREICQCQ